MRATTLSERRRLYLLARVLVARHYRRDLTLETVSGALSCSSRQLQRAYALFGEQTFHEDLVARRLSAAGELLAEQAIPIRDVARLVGYRNAAHFAAAFRRRYGVSPARFRLEARCRRASASLGAGKLAGAPHIAGGVSGVGSGSH
ncbi:MAG: helix-turn-helix domain-containing protein [Solirubrobacterales bacterium]